MLPSILAKQLQKGIGDYIETTFPMTNEPFKGSVQKMLANKGSVYHEPYVAVRLPFRVAEEMPTCFEAIHPAYLPYVHQQKAFERLTGDDGRSTLVATGTGSGKTECFLYPILEYCYQHRGERGIKALIIYPMNALATDQAKRIAELIYGSDELRGNVTVGMYVGGQEHTPARTMSEHGVITDHETMLNNAPDILMTNYKMLDYLLVRPKDALLWQDNDSETLKYIAVDELHTFDGAQGTDLACLLRRLKRRLGIYDGYLCCIGTSATMGSKENNSNILNYAEEIFGEPFDKDAIITEDRLSAQEFFAGVDVTEFAMPTAEQAWELKKLSEEDEPSAYLKSAVKCWFPNFTLDVLDDEGRIQLGHELMHHSFMQSVINLTSGTYYQVSKIAEDLATHYPELKTLADAATVINSLFALISHARTGKAGRLRPFLNVQVQLWMRELRRLVAKVDNEEITYEIANDLNKQQAKQYLPVVNCRDCGITGWVSVLNERSNATMTNLESFYNLYFRADEKIVMMFPYSHEEHIPGMIPAKICQDCLQVKLGDEGTDQCVNCGAEMVDVMIPNPTTEEIRKHAFALLNGISFDDLDENLDPGDKCQSLTHGENPIYECFNNANDEFDFLLDEVKKLKENGVALTDICVVARTKKLVDDYVALFTRAGIRSYAIKRNKVDDRSFDGLRVATMHRVKGLEFKYVFVAAVNNRVIPLPSAINKTDAISEAESITSEKCLLYVAMTRAQKGVYITSYGRRSEFID